MATILAPHARPPRVVGRCGGQPPVEVPPVGGTAWSAAEPDMREALKGQLESAKAEGAVQAIQSPTSGG